MKHPILGLHHVTATVNQAQPDVDFYADLLGLRLIKRTVNFDNHNVYHFYYGNERGTPGTIWTTFPYAGWGVPEGRHGEGQITTTSFSVPAGSLGWWTERLRRRGATAESTTASGGNSLRVKDPSGLVVELRENPDDPRPGWIGGGIEPGAAIRGLDGVTLSIRSPGPTVALLTELLGFTVVDESERLVRLAVNGNEPGKRVELLFGTGAPAARNGLGTVHHVAFAIANGEQQRQLRTELLQLGYSVTEVMDRQYFQSIYFREPGGVLFEVATAGPGFAVDEEVSALGRELKLPPWEEPNRAEIERQLPAIKAPDSHRPYASTVS
jgi:glyoxalase family protein